MDFSELRQMGEELIAMGSQEVNNSEKQQQQQQDSSSSSAPVENVSNETKNETNDAFTNYSSLTFSSSYRNVEPSIASTSYSSAIDDPLASAASHPSTSQHTYFNASELLGINSLYKNNLGLQFPGEFTSPPVMEDIAEGDEGATEKLMDEPVLHIHEGDSRETSTSSVMKDSEVSQLLSQQLDCWNFNDGSKHDSSDWNMNLNGEHLDTLHDSSFQPTVNMLKQADQRENFDTSSLYFSTYGSDYAPSMDNLDTRQFFPNPQQPLVSITSSSAPATASAVTSSSSSSNTKVSTEKRFQPTKHRVARKELRTLPAKLEKAKKKKQQQEQQQKQLMLQQNQSSVPSTTTTTSNVLQMPNLPSNTMSSFHHTFTRPASASVSSASSYSAQSTSQQSLTRQIHSTSPRLEHQSPMEQELVHPSDMTETTRLIYTAFAQTKFVYYDSADDKRAKRSSVPDGFVGFACKHCEGKSKCSADTSSKKKPKFARCGRYFPSNIKTFADRSKTLNALVKHLIKCPSVPLETRNNLILFEQSHEEETKMKRLLNASYTQKDIFKVMWNRLHPGAEE